MKRREKEIEEEICWFTEEEEEECDVMTGREVGSHDGDSSKGLV